MFQPNVANLTNSVSTDTESVIFCRQQQPAGFDRFRGCTINLKWCGATPPSHLTDTDR